MVRLAEALGTGLGRTQPGAAQGQGAARPAVRCARFVAGARATTWSPTRESWHLLAGDVTLPSADELRADVHRGRRNGKRRKRCAAAVLRTLYRDRLLVLAGLDLASTVENEPVLPFTEVGEHLSDLADAALAAALTVATRSVCGDDGEPPRLAVIAMGKCGARELNYVSDVDVIFVAEDGRRRRDPGGRRDDAVRRRTRSSRSTRRCGRRASTASWCARWTRTSPTTSAGPRRGSSRR